MLCRHAVIALCNLRSECVFWQGSPVGDFIQYASQGPFLCSTRSTQQILFSQNSRDFLRNRRRYELVDRYPFALSDLFDVTMN